MNQQKIGKFIQERRKIKELTQLELAEKLGVSNRTISKWENGNSLPDYSIIHDLCEVLDISINELLSGEELTEENYQNKLEENFISTIDYNNKKRNKRIKKVFVLTVILIILYLLYKAFIINYYDTRFSSGSEEKEFPFNQNIHELNIHKNAKANHIFNEDNEIHFYLPEGFELVTDKAKSNLVMDNCDVYLKNQTSKEEFDATIFVCRVYGDNLENLDHYEIRDTLFPLLYVSHVLEKYNIHDTMDLIHYYEKHYDDKYNVFTPSDKIKMHYIAKTYTQMSVPVYDDFYYLTGDLYGRLTEYENKKLPTKWSSVYSATFYIRYDQYSTSSTSITFHNNNENYFNHENVVEILESIYREKSTSD